MKIKELDFKELQLILDSQKEANRHNEAKYNKAHQTYQSKSNMADDIANQIINRNLPIIALLVVVNVALVYFLKDNASLIAIASNIIGVAMVEIYLMSVKQL
ncbi:MAG: hypothetical protein Q9M43_10765 [Sulfurimonas sp.]|nr:hypothetical protein [Sulfurimonas sp.]